MGECWLGPQFKFSKTVEVRWSFKDLQLCQREITTDEIQEEENYREGSNIKSVRVSALTGSVFHAKWPRSCRAFQNPTGIEPKSPESLLLILTTKPLVRINSGRKNSI